VTGNVAVSTDIAALNYKMSLLLVVMDTLRKRELDVFEYPQKIVRIPVS